MQTFRGRVQGEQDRGQGEAHVRCGLGNVANQGRRGLRGRVEGEPVDRTRPEDLLHKAGLLVFAADRAARLRREDLHRFSRRPLFHELVTKLATQTRCPAIFILSSHRAGAGARSGGFGDATTTKAYFPDTLLEHPQVCEHKLLQVRRPAFPGLL